MKRWFFRLLDAHEPSIRAAGALKERHENPERAQRAVRHVAGEESPRVLRATHRLPKLEGLLGADQPSVDAGDSGDDLPEVLFDPFLERRRQVRQHTGDVAPVPLQEIAGVGRLKVSNSLRIQVVEPRARQRVVDGAKRLAARHRDQVQAIGRGGRRRRQRALADAPTLQRVEVGNVAVSRENVALFALDLVPSLSPGADRERIVTPRLDQFEPDANPEMRRVAAGPAANLVDPAPIAQGVIHGIAQRVSDEAERVEEVALARTVRTDEKRELGRRDVAGGETLVVAKHDPRQQPAVVSHCVRLSSAAFYPLPAQRRDAELRDGVVDLERARADATGRPAGGLAAAGRPRRGASPG